MEIIINVSTFFFNSSSILRRLSIAIISSIKASTSPSTISGPGGQSVNTTDSAVRVTHIPTGVSVASQQEKSQHRNKEIAIRILRSRLLEAKQQEEANKHSIQRKSQIGTGDRSERIRTYNYPQSRVTDHRIGYSQHNLPAVMDGSIDEFIENLRLAENAEKMEQEQQRSNPGG